VGEETSEGTDEDESEWEEEEGEWDVDEFDTLAVPGGVSAMWVNGKPTPWPPGASTPDIPVRIREYDGAGDAVSA